ncbi:hypothetical protein UA08_00352 [Talaromyces atroroseus]|uniref:Uncharacterized protein n=1 Tax=Talaromyces atroroseus TaxID=1441469 RepID=A0A225BDA9_TALAT|nr:hypothetical protein UA08_00352 [Talaromyces atroroseus]OKL64007.1 hypothetical protein UA08_00352 [Talaromyces atroroseus]
MQTTRSQQAWIRAVILVGLYLILSLSFTQCALVLYLYGSAQVDDLETPSLIIGLVASFLSVPFVVIHTILSWQYRRVPGLNMPRNALHMACSHLPRIMVAMWLAASVAGLVLVSKQVTCVPVSQAQQFWKAGMSCQIHRGTVILSILAFVISSALFFCFQVCERPYDASLLGLNAPQRPPRDGSIFSESSWESETLKNEIFYLCRHPDAGPGNGELYWSPNDSSLFETPVRPPSIRYPGPARVRPQLRITTHTNSIRPTIATTSLSGTSPAVSPVDETAAGSVSARSDVSPLSRNPSMTSTLQMGTEAAFTRPPVPRVPDIPEIPPQSQSQAEQQQQQQHKRQKSSVSSRKFLPKDLNLFEPLSEDPQIRALASPPSSPEIAEPVQQLDEREKEDGNPGLSHSTLPTPPAPARVNDSQSTRSNPAQTRRRSMTAPGNPPPVLPPVPLTVRKSRTSHLNPAPRAIHQSHVPHTTPKPATRRPSHRQSSMGRAHYPPHHPRIQTSLSNHSSIIIRDHPQRQRRFHTSSSLSRNTQLPRHAPMHHQHYQPQHQQHMNYPQPRHLHPHLPARPAYVRRFHSNDGRGFDPARTLPPIPRSDDTATLYPSTRRPRSSTYGGSSSSPGTSSGPVHKSSKSIQAGEREVTGQNARTSLSLADGGVALEADRDIVERKNTYRGAERTSICAV